MMYPIKTSLEKFKNPHSHSSQIPIVSSQLLQHKAQSTNQLFKCLTMIPVSLISLLILATVITITEATTTHVNGSATAESGEEPPFVPLVVAGKFEKMVINETRRKLGSFQICALCTCCGGAKGVCMPSPCCYAINCNIPNRPFGFCSFTPKTCNCLGCHI